MPGTEPALAGYQLRSHPELKRFAGIVAIGIRLRGSAANYVLELYISQLEIDPDGLVSFGMICVHVWSSGLSGCSFIVV